MKWSEVREKYPNTFVKIQALESHVSGNKRIIDNLGLLEIYTDGFAAMKDFKNNSEGEYIINTANTELEVELTKFISLRKMV
ncbi:MAG: hypothetical protein ACRC6T_08890 [Sarcina sp.]